MDQDATTAAWVSLDDFKRLYPEFQLEDELLLQGARDVMTGQDYQCRTKRKKEQDAEKSS